MYHSARRRRAEDFRSSPAQWLAAASCTAISSGGPPFLDMASPTGRSRSVVAPNEPVDRATASPASVVRARRAGKSYSRNLLKRKQNAPHARRLHVSIHGYRNHSARWERREVGDQMDREFTSCRRTTSQSTPWVTPSPNEQGVLCEGRVNCQARREKSFWRTIAPLTDYRMSLRRADIAAALRRIVWRLVDPGSTPAVNEDAQQQCNYNNTIVCILITNSVSITI